MVLNFFVPGALLELRRDPVFPRTTENGSLTESRTARTEYLIFISVYTEDEGAAVKVAVLVPMRGANRQPRNKGVEVSVQTIPQSAHFIQNEASGIQPTQLREIWRSLLALYKVEGTSG